ncbi:type II CAAX prenyl endopeptidase Rce1 family protein [Kitasatospora sp. NPDC058060]
MRRRPGRRRLHHPAAPDPGRHRGLARPRRPHRRRARPLSTHRRRRGRQPGRRPAPPAAQPARPRPARRRADAPGRSTGPLHPADLAHSRPRGPVRPVLPPRPPCGGRGGRPDRPVLPRPRPDGRVRRSRSRAHHRARGDEPGAALIEELVLTGALVTIGRQLRVPVPVLLAAAAAGRIALHAYLGAPGLASAVFAVAAVALYWDQRRLLPLVAAHVAWDLYALVLAPA